MDALNGDIIRRAAGGDRQAFEIIYKQYGGVVYTLAFRICARHEDAEEITQDVFVRIHRKLGEFQFASSLKTWIYRIAVNTAINHVKKYAKHEKKVENYPLSNVNPYMVTAETNIEAKEKADNIQQLFNLLNEDQRACLYLRSVEQMSYAEIAETLDININTVRTRIKRAREKLMEHREEGKVNEIYG